MMTPQRFVGHIRSIVAHPLCKKAPLSALGRYIRWQIGSRLVPGPIIVPLTDQAKMVVSRGMTGATCNIYTGLHDFNEMSFCLHLLRPDDLFVDVGANVGVYSILASAVVGASSIAFEPVPATYVHLLENIATNKIESRVHAIQKGVGAKTCSLRFTSTLDTVNHVLSQSENVMDWIEVPIITLDETLTGQQPVLIKIDVEGFEEEVIKGAEETLSGRNVLAIIMELNSSGERYGKHDVELKSLMRRLGFETCSYDPFKRVLTPSDASTASHNSLLVRSFNEVCSRLRAAPPFSVFGQLL